MNPIKREYKGDYIRGQFVRVNDPNDEVISKNPGSLDEAHIPVPFSYESIHEGVIAAKRSFLSWKRIPAKDRVQALSRYRDGISARAEELAHYLSFEVGKPLWEARHEVKGAVRLFDYFLSLGSQTEKEEEVTNIGDGSTGKVRFLPRGVMAVITPGAQPLFMPHTHLIPALLNGNTAVLKASKYAPFTSQLLAEIVHDSGFPAGVLNILQGNSESARRLVIHPEVDGVLYTGSYETAEKIRKQLLSDFWKIQIFELGGKNSLVVWDDCNYKKALSEALLGAFLTSGQRCTNTNRILVHDKIFDKFLNDFHGCAKKIRVGYGLTEGDQSPFMGPLMSEAALEDYLRFQGIATREGCEEIMRGKSLDRERKGFYVSPSIHVVTNPDPKAIYQKSEIHGPNVAFYRVKDIDEASEMINQSQYGLVASIYSGARENYLRLAEEAQVGILHWNRPTTHVSYKLPYGGIKRSGNMRTMGQYAGYQCTYPLSCIEADSNTPVGPLPKELPTLDSPV